MKRAVARFLLLVFFVFPVFGQQSQNLSSVPHLVRFAGVLKDSGGQPLKGTIGLTFALYRDQEGGAPLWLETQNVAVDAAGHYNSSLGATKAEGLPVALFASGEARWLGVQPAGQAEQPRVLLLSVPYALKAADAETVGGLPPSAFVLAAPPSALANSTPPAISSSSAPAASIGGSGTLNFLPIWTGATTLGSSALFQSGSGATAKVGIGTKTPTATLDVKGAATIEGLLTLPANGVATAAGGKTSQPNSFVASSFNSSTKAAVNQTFQWKAESAGNNTAAPSGTLNLLFAAGAAAPAETGLKVSNKGILTFAAGQTFPGLGTITGVTAGTDLTGGGTSGNVTLNLNTASTDARYAQLGASNSFSVTQQINAAATGLTANVTSPSGVAVLASVKSGTGNGIAVQGLNLASKGIGVMGQGSVGVSGISGNGIGVQGTTSGGTGVLGTDTAAGMGVEGVSTNGTAVYGFSSNSNGVYGNTSHGTGVQGISGGDVLNTAGVFGRAGNGTLFGGIAGVWGDADQHVGVFGSSNNFAGVIGESTNGYGVQAISSGADGVNAVSHTIKGSGVAGINDAAGGLGVYGHSTSTGFGFYTDSNAAQARNTGGWVKAMAYVDPFAPGGIAVTRCYNSQQSGAAITTPPCGISVVSHKQGVNVLDFGFQVSDRFLSATSFSTGVFASTGPFSLNANQLVVGTIDALGGTVADDPFFIFVY